MVNRIEIKEAAKKQIEGNIGSLFLCYLLISVIIAASSFVFIGPIILSPVFLLSFTKIKLNLAKKIEPKVENIFDGFSAKGFERSIILGILIYVYTFLWTLLFIIPGVIKSISYSMSYYVLAEHPEMSATEALKESERITYGHKWELFILNLSFIGWYLLVPITFGLISIYLIPYQEMTYTNFYNKIKDKK